MFRLSREPLEPMTLADARAGGFVTFEGRVRNENHGRSVVSLEYEAFEEMALREGANILEDAMERFPITAARCSHRLGRLEIGETALLVSVASPHRSEAFDACRFIVDEVKHRLPIWKKEFYADGDTGWVNCDCGALPSLDGYYSRQTILPEIGAQGQERLRQARVLVVGAGGLGSPALLYLAGAGVGTLGIAEDDLLHVSNLHRQVIYAAQDLDKPKANLAANAVRRLNPTVEVHEHGKLSAQTAEEVMAGYDLVLDCTDNFEAKFLLSDLAVKLSKPLVQASIYQFEGQVHTYLPGRSACMRCLWPETPDAGCVGTCAEVGVMGFTAGLFGVLQATEAVKYLAGFGDLLAEHTLLIDLLSYDVRRILRARNPQCPGCGSGRPRAQPGWRISGADALRSNLPILDLREPAEHPTAWPSAQARWSLAPLSTFGDTLPDLGSPDGYILICSHGARSEQVARALWDRGDRRFRSLIGGWGALG